MTCAFHRQAGPGAPDFAHLGAGATFHRPPCSGLSSMARLAFVPKGRSCALARRGRAHMGSSIYRGGSARSTTSWRKIVSAPCRGKRTYAERLHFRRFCRSGRRWASSCVRPARAWAFPYSITPGRANIPQAAAGPRSEAEPHAAWALAQSGVVLTRPHSGPVPQAAMPEVRDACQPSRAKNRRGLLSIHLYRACACQGGSPSCCHHIMRSRNLSQ